MNENPFHWQRTLARLAPMEHSDDVFECPPAGVPVPGAPCPPEVRVPLRAVLRQAFLAGNREAPLVDALAEVEGWSGFDVEAWRGDAVPRVQIVVPVRGAHDALRLCLDCLDAHAVSDRLTAFATIAVAQGDEARAVGRLAVEKTARPWLELVTTPAPQSFAANVNLGASRSRSEFLVLLNSDAFVGPNWLDALLAPFADPDVVAVGPMGTNVSGHQGVAETDALSGDMFGPSGDTAHRVRVAADVTRAFHDGRQRVLTTHPPQRGPLPYPARRLVGFCLAVRRSAWDRVGGMDEQFANAYCDDDLSLRLSLVGKCVVVPDLLVLHAGQASFRELPDFAATYNRTLAENAKRFAAKWGWLLPDWRKWNDERGWK